MANFSGILSPKQECFITLHPNSKRPILQDWPNKGQMFKEAQLSRHNIGLLLGKPSGLLDVDLDCEASVTLAKAILPKPYARFGRGVKHSGHYLYRCSNSGPRKAFTASRAHTMMVELRGDGTQTMVPPSIHPDGEAVSWIDADDEATEVTYEELLKAVALLAAATELMEYWKEGQRHTLALGFAVISHNLAVDPNVIMNIIHKICEASADIEVQDRLNAVRTTIRRPAVQSSGFQLLQETLGDAVARNIASHLAIAVGERGSLQPFKELQPGGKVIELGQFADRANVTEAKMGRTFSQWLTGKALYVVQTKQWMIWNEQYWEADLSNEMHNLAFEYVQDVKATLIKRNSVNDSRNYRHLRA